MPHGSSDVVSHSIPADVGGDYPTILAERLAAAGYVLAPLSADEKMLVAALLLGTTEPAQEDWDAARRACRMLSRPADELEREGVVDAAAYLAQNYRAMISVIRPSNQTPT